jgi:hypothetical protein
MYLYKRLEQIILNNRHTGETLRRNQRAISGTDIPSFLQDHWAVVQRSVQVWMCTVGAAIAPERLEDARAVWRHLVGATASAREAIAQLREVGNATGAMYGEAGVDFLSDVDTEEAIKACSFVPNFLR